MSSRQEDQPQRLVFCFTITTDPNKNRTTTTPVHLVPLIMKPEPRIPENRTRTEQQTPPFRAITIILKSKIRTSPTKNRTKPERHQQKPPLKHTTQLLSRYFLQHNSHQNANHPCYACGKLPALPC